MAAMAKKVLLLRSAEGKVLMAPTWDGRPFPQFLPPLETGMTTRALEKVIYYWTAHNRAAARGYADGDLLECDLEFVRRLGEEKGLLGETYAAAMLLERKNLADLIVLFARSRARADESHCPYIVEVPDSPACPCIEEVPDSPACPCIEVPASLACPCVVEVPASPACPCSETEDEGQRLPWASTC